jgi:hypothetical protein
MRRFIPTLTPLESRDCPTGTAIIVDHTLYISTDPRSETVVIQDDGHDRVTATLSGAGGETSVSAVGIDTFFIQMRGTHDRLVFDVTEPPPHAMTLVVDGGWEGNKSIEVELPTVAGAGLVTLDFRGDLGQGQADVLVGATELKRLTILDRLSGGTVKVSAPNADDYSTLGHSAVRTHSSGG